MKNVKTPQLPCKKGCDDNHKDIAKKSAVAKHSKLHIKLAEISKKLGLCFAIYQR